MMSKKKVPLLSIIVPAYNIENYIERCLKSICKQTYNNLEIIVVDDGSKDGTGIIIDRMAKQDTRILAIHKKNAGVSAARNTGLDIAHGEYIGFVDGDDYIDADMYKRLLENAIAYNADISHCGYQMVFSNRVDYYYNTGEILVQDTKQGIYDLIKADKIEPGLCNKLYKRSLIGSCRLDDTIKINEDLLFNYMLFKKSQTAVFEDVCLYYYMVRENSASTSSMNINKLQDPLKVVSYIMQQEVDDIYALLEKRYMYLLEKISMTKGITKDKLMFDFQREAREELRRKLVNNNLKAQYSKREMCQMKLAVYAPGVYRPIHAVYSIITGSKNKYKV